VRKSNPLPPNTSTPSVPSVSVIFGWTTGWCRTDGDDCGPYPFHIYGEPYRLPSLLVGRMGPIPTS
jgi:hypothetical protein